MKGIVKLYVRKLNKKVNRYSLKTKKRGLIVFGIAISFICLMLILHSIINPSAISIKTGNISQPKIEHK